MSAAIAVTDAHAVDLLVRDAALLVTVDADHREIAGGWVAISNGRVVAIGEPGDEPTATRVLRADGCLVTPGLVNAHHHLFQNLTRAYAPATAVPLFQWLQTLYPLWARLDEESAYVSAWVGLAELALGGCTTSSDHLYVFPRGAGKLVDATIAAARDVGMRFHATRGSMSLSEKDGGLPPDDVVQDSDEILTDCERIVRDHHDADPHALVKVALAPCSPFSVTRELMRATAELAERLDVRLHTHLAEDRAEDAYCEERFGCRPLEYFEDAGWGTERAWIAHCVHPSPAEIARLARWGTGVAHCPSSNQILGAGLAPVRTLRDAGVPVGLGCDGSASADAGSLWLEARTAMLLARLRDGPSALSARDVLDIATTGAAACLGCEDVLGTLRPGSAADLVAWHLDDLRVAGALTDPVEAWLRCGPFSAHHTVVAGNVLVERGELRIAGLEGMLARHRVAAARMQGV